MVLLPLPTSKWNIFLWNINYGRSPFQTLPTNLRCNLNLIARTSQANCHNHLIPLHQSFLSTGSKPSIICLLFLHVQMRCRVRLSYNHTCTLHYVCLFLAGQTYDFLSRCFIVLTQYLEVREKQYDGKAYVDLFTVSSNYCAQCANILMALVFLFT